MAHRCRSSSSVILSAASPRAQSKDLGAGYHRGLGALPRQKAGQTRFRARCRTERRNGTPRQGRSAPLHSAQSVYRKAGVPAPLPGCAPFFAWYRGCYPRLKSSTPPGWQSAARPFYKPSQDDRSFLMPNVLSFRLLPSAFCLLPSAFCFPPTAFCFPSTAFCFPRFRFSSRPFPAMLAACSHSKKSRSKSRTGRKNAGCSIAVVAANAARAVRRRHRPVGLRQIDAAQDHRRADRPHRGRRALGRARPRHGGRPAPGRTRLRAAVQPRARAVSPCANASTTPRACAWPGRTPRNAPDRVDALLETVGLDDLADRQARVLSGGPAAAAFAGHRDGFLALAAAVRRGHQRPGPRQRARDHEAACTRFPRGGRRAAGGGQRHAQPRGPGAL